MDFLSFLYTNGLIQKMDFDEIQEEQGQSSDKIGNILVEKRVLPYKEIVKQLSLYVNSAS